MRPVLPWLACAGCGLHLNVPADWVDVEGDVQKVARRVLGAHRAACRGGLAAPSQASTPKRKKKRAHRGSKDPVKAALKTIGEEWASALMKELLK